MIVLIRLLAPFIAAPIVGYLALYVASLMGSPTDRIGMSCVIILGQFTGIAGGIRMLFERWKRMMGAITLALALVSMTLDIVFGFRPLSPETPFSLSSTMIAGSALVAFIMWLLSLPDARRKLMVLDGLAVIAAVALLVPSVLALSGMV